MYICMYVYTYMYTFMFSSIDIQLKNVDIVYRHIFMKTYIHI